MTEEEMRAKITELESENKKLQENFNTINEQIKVKDNEINLLNSTVSDLKQKNYDLFIQVSSPVEQPTKGEQQKEDTMTVSEVISSLI